MDINSFLSVFSIASLGINWVDFSILIIFGFYMLSGMSSGFIVSFLDLLGFAISFTAGLYFYGFIGKFLTTTFMIPIGFANAGGFFIASFVAEIVITLVIKKIILSLKVFEDTGLKDIPKFVNSTLGALTSFLSGLILTSFLLTLIISLPTSNFLKNSVLSSRIGSIIVENTQGFSKSLNNIFGGALNETLTFLTVEPKSNESVKLNYKINNIIVDAVSEQKMLVLVNKERISKGIQPLSSNIRLTEVARKHCEDMFKRGYFSHYTPESLSPFDRMGQDDISFTYAGENLALAPNVDLAHQGLMQSLGHKENILSPDFGRVGIGVIDGGIYGEMFCQEFTD